jgi:hypothetical protein
VTADPGQCLRYTGKGNDQGHHDDDVEVIHECVLLREYVCVRCDPAPTAHPDRMSRRLRSHRLKQIGECAHTVVEDDEEAVTLASRALRPACFVSTRQRPVLHLAEGTA